MSLDWYFDSNNPAASPLIALANKKSRVSHPGLPDIFDAYFPNEIRGKPFRKWVLEYTRLRPRDFLQLLTFIKDSCTQTEIDRGSFLEALRKYSQEYFIPEVKNDLFGFVDRAVVESIFRVIQHQHLREFSFDALKQAVRKYDPKRVIGDLVELCELLYEAGIIGNVFHTAPRLKDGMSFPRYTFRYRSSESTFNQLDEVIVHKALWSGLRLT